MPQASELREINVQQSDEHNAALLFKGWNVLLRDPEDDSISGVGIRVIKRVHDAVSQPLSSGSIELVGPVIQTKEEAQKIRDNSELLGAAINVACPTQSPCVQTMELTFLRGGEIGYAEEPFVGRVGDCLRMRIASQGIWDLGCEVRDRDVFQILAGWDFNDHRECCSVVKEGWLAVGDCH
ncbi:hypothetical protein PHLCEN_2v4923 [Hermanssonia centrifuga]|uniref:Uncharacterized protein n=1 Tax=Hermanssonia centrifuga TaxID=98765 RepID=A0A2R6P1D6_9APHY|nr:hypothetical protein PHLCEN_2v5811 [Hermanssonia centrifuga]PSR90361.1 hypothetical protein PHLCEN_2v4923 [Hermanssonia centrifuga]